MERLPIARSNKCNLQQITCLVARPESPFRALIKREKAGFQWPGAARANGHQLHSLAVCQYCFRMSDEEAVRTRIERLHGLLQKVTEEAARQELEQLLAEAVQELDQILEKSQQR